MKLWRIIAALGAGLLVLGSCNGPEPEEPVLPAALTASVLQLEPASGSVFLSVTASKDWSITASYSGDSGWATVSPATGSGSRNSVILSYGVNDSEEARSVTLTLTANPGGQASLTLTQKGIVKPDVPPQQYGYGYDVAAPHWLELPATKADDGKEWFAHDMNGGDYFSKPNNKRNWSFYYDYDSYLATWVAYPLNKSLIGNGERTNRWNYDSLIPNDWQQSLDRGFRVEMNGQMTTRYYSDPAYDRGHQLPSADRLNNSANISTFYFTNMTPQNGSFNSDIWADLETRVRSYATSSDTLYVVTGCIVDDESSFVRDVAGHSIPVPSAYYKALLRYMPGSTYGDYIACAFYLPHNGSIAKEDYRKYIMSVKDLEDKTGIEFFVNLPEAVGADNARKIKSQEPVSWWK